ncbi:hypothetical protein EMIHUDRAFT_215576 [Emiliania huxleyi CCMP1516]|uniref:Hexosyltransferase n=2 Tax=Emiliania huxleyi TaxID=2903 RepID=A0A0D3IGL6_EMIH1|nr:hypothetical protein EMIHUDRAFT_215576 [Emiliania huxleyi CCMP1516]EOD10401.1 hypothetical protein EMIHUDRAFT_215576 [Emiliania huxleyi CCMP1516]|eukprot:XP_005762830.1 hypothetical protein EMIHUDRAFT_215576 [Emiliania huxleyi CCMP1516]
MTSTNGAFAFALVVLMLGLVSVDNVPTNAQQECLSGVGENDSTLLAVLGVLSHAPQQRLRDAWRRHILPVASPDIAVRFVMRGFGVPTHVNLEAKTHGDVILLRANSSLPRGTGPLVSLRLWYSCALSAFPQAAYVGKADDDTFVHLPSISRQLQALPPDTPTYWGNFECYHWNMTRQTPTWFCFDYPRGTGSCRMNQQVLGPFAFAKGALNFLSQSLARHLVRSKLAANSASAAVRTFAEYEQITRGRECGHCLPFEDVWTGAAIARLTELPSLRLVSSPPTSAIVHLKDKASAKEFEAWSHVASRRSHCDAATINTSSMCTIHPARTCGGAEQQFCRGTPQHPLRGSCPGDELYEAEPCKDNKHTNGWCLPKRRLCTANERDFVTQRCRATCGRCTPHVTWIDGLQRWVQAKSAQAAFNASL